MPALDSVGVALHAAAAFDLSSLEPWQRDLGNMIDIYTVFSSNIAAEAQMGGPNAEACGTQAES